MTELVLPPPYRAEEIARGRSAVAEALAAARAGREEGVIFWADRTDRFDCGLILKPDRPRREILPVIYVAALAFADALGAFAPPPTPIGFGWPGDILIDGGIAGRLSLTLAPGAADVIPGWAALGFDLALSAESDEPGRAPTRTCIAEEAFEGFSVAVQIEGFSRHFLAWLNRWDSQGLAPIAAEWSRRAFTPLAPAVALDGRQATPLRLDATGNLMVRHEGRERRLSLDAALTERALHG